MYYLNRSYSRHNNGIPKYTRNFIPEPVNMLPHTATETVQILSWIKQMGPIESHD